MKHTVRVAVISSAVTLTVCAGVSVALFFGFFGTLTPSGTDDASSATGLIRSYIEQDAIFDFDDQAAEDNMLAAYVIGGLTDDRYADYYTPEEYKEKMTSNAGGFAGFGMQMTSVGEAAEGVFLYRVIGGSPAETAGFRPGDRIVRVNGQDLTALRYEDATEKIISCKTETTLFTVRRGEETLEISVSPAVFTEDDVSWQVLDGIGYIRIYNFTSVAAIQFRSALKAVLDLNVKGIIFDVRNNPGGMLASVESILETLVPKGDLIVKTEYKNQEENYYSREDAWTDIPMVVMINGSSASASELFASELRDAVGAKLVGTTSFGKGVGQTIRRLPSGAALKMTTFKYYTKNHNEYDGIGLVPDVEIALPEEKAPYIYALSPAEDDQLCVAYETITDMIEGN